MAQEEVAANFLVDLADRSRRQLQHVQRTEKAAIGLIPPTHVARAPPAGGSQRIEPAVVAHPSEGIPIDGIVGQLGQVRPGLQAVWVLGRHRSHRLPTAVRREGSGLVESGGQLRMERVEDGLGAPGSEMDCMLGGHLPMLRAPIEPQPENGRSRATQRRSNVVRRRAGSTLRAVLTPDPRPTSFQNHPGLRDREPEARELADVLRRLIRLSVSAAPPAAETTRLTARLAALADELETHLPADPLPRFIPPDEDGPPKDVPLGGAMPYDVVVGPFNPVALPVVLDFDPPKALGRGVFDVTYEGAPGCVHGAVLAATFDIILTAANAIVGSVGPTVSLALRYVRPTLTNEEAVFEGWVTEVTERRIFSKGRIVQGGVVTVEAEGEFAIFSQDRVNGLASSRRPAPDGTPSAGAMGE